MPKPPAPDAPTEGTKTFSYHVIRYSPNPVRDEWLNIGILLFDPGTGERRLRLIESPEEFGRVRRLHPQADEGLLRSWRSELQDRFEETTSREGDWQEVLSKLESILSVSIQLASKKGVHAADLDAEMDRLYGDHVALQRPAPRIGAPGPRPAMRGYCDQVWKLSGLWHRVEKSVRIAEFTFQGDPMRIDYAYRRNGTRGYVQTLSVSRSPADCKMYAYTAERIAARAPFKSEFAAVTDVPLLLQNPRHRFVQDTLLDAGIQPVALEGFAVWVNRLKSAMT